MISEIHKQALWLCQQGCSVIPLNPRSKRPCGDLLPIIDGKASWKPYQEKKATEEEINGWFARKPDINIGLVCGYISGVVCIDVDGEIGQKWFVENMPEAKLWQYTSGPNKFHAFYKHPGENIRIPPSVKMINDEIDIRGDGSYCVFAPSIHPSGKVYELRASKDFTCISDLTPCPNLKIKKDYEPKHEDEYKIRFAEDIPEGQRDAGLTRLCGRWYAKGLSEDEVSALAHAFNTAHCKPPLGFAQVDKIVKSIGKTHANNHPVMQTSESLRSWIKDQQGQFRIADIFAQLAVNRKQDKDSILNELKILIRDGEIEQIGINSNTFRKVDKSFVEIDLTEKEDNVIPMNLLFDLSYRVRIREKNIIIVAGETNSGKTAFLFNTVYMNRDKHKFRYITSEMTAQEIRSRIKRYGCTVEEFSQFCKFYYKTDNFADIIDPDGINIIDYLEKYDNFYEIGSDIKKIFDKLRHGCAFIAIQKKKGEMFARGGEFTLEKARLGISLFCHGRVSDGIFCSALVTKCKNYVADKNPEGREYFYKLTNGVYYDCNIPELFSGVGCYFDTKSRNQLINRIHNYCKEQQDQEMTLSSMYEQEYY